LTVPPIRKQKRWKTSEEKVSPDLGAGMHQQHPNHVADMTWHITSPITSTRKALGTHSNE